MNNFLSNNLLWTEGWIIILIALIGMGIGWYYSKLIFGVSLFLLCFSFYFFRNPDRVCPSSGNIKRNALIVAPADGVIVAIKNDLRKVEGYAQRISIFLSLFDAHVTWAPVSGIVKDVQYSPGCFTLAYRPKSSLLNEHNDIVIERLDGSMVKVRQIAGSVARRIRCWVHPGDKLDVCNKVGMIRFGSRVDLFLPAGVTLQVRVGQQVYGGQTLLGFFNERT